MRVVAYKILDENIKIEIEKIKDIEINEESILGVDCSATCTGITVLGLNSQKPLYTIACHRSNDETSVRYKVYLKMFMKNVLLLNKDHISDIFYEEPFIGKYVESSMVLISLKTFIPEILIENENEINKVIEFHEISNKSWKKDLLGSKLPVGTEEEKNAIAEKIDRTYKCYVGLTQDEHDSYGIAKYGANILYGKSESKEKYKKGYALEGEFIGAENDDMAIAEYQYIRSSVPKRLRDKIVEKIDIDKKHDVEDEVYRALNGIDTVILAKFIPKEQGRILLKYQLGELTNSSYIYWYVWRKVKYNEKR